MRGFRCFIESVGMDYFDSSALLAARNQSSKSRELLIDMDIDDFLKLAESGRSGDKERGVDDLLSSGVKFSSIPFLGVGFSDSDPFAMQVRSHEGRHRARALKRIGIKTMPVRIIHDSIRWGGQISSDNYDYVDKFPTHFVSEGGGEVVPFGVTREDLELRF